MSTTSIVKTGCLAADVLFTAEKAAAFREMVGRAHGRDCLCEPGEHCDLLDLALRGLERAVVPSKAGESR